MVRSSWGEQLPEVLDHHAILSLTTLFGGALSMPVMLDGPRSTLGWWMMGIGEAGEEEEAELFGSADPSPAELWAWRLRLPFYLLLRAFVTDGFTADPEALAAARTASGVP